MDIGGTLDFIHSVKWRGRKPGLGRTRELLEALGNPDKSLKFVHIAGTNGKGSTAACIESVLRQAGYRTGLFISPYVLRFNERIQACGEHITDDEIVRMAEIMRPYAEVMEDTPTEFELITALAMQFFKYKQCDIVVLEVGMGGELDSTNVIDTPEAAVITAIGFDHVKELGPAIEDIAMAKAGIIKGGDVVIYGGSPEVEAVFQSVSQERGAKLHKADFMRIADERFSLGGVSFSFEPYGDITLPLAGTYQPKNAAVAITALEVLRAKGYCIKDEHIKNGLGGVYWPGRFEVLGSKPVFILDGSHNPQGAEATAESLQCHFRDKKLVFIIGVMADKDIDAIVRHIAPLAEAFIAVRPDNPRAMDEQSLANRLERYGAPVIACGSVDAGVAEAIKIAGEDGAVCALGSLFISGDVREAYAGYTKKHSSTSKNCRTESSEGS